MKYRTTRESCVVCGRQIPIEVSHSVDGSVHEYRCPECGDGLLFGIVLENGQEPTHPTVSPPPLVRSVEIPLRTEWDTWESWWTDYHAVVAIHGRVVAGKEELLDYVRKIKDRA